ncbi:hypothetical protein [Aeoliella sp.]|uniref:hypothetical protein n=1 Tax=Aeoliella sp. TaxID=2795800 RepID=UPI003CCBC5FE
MTGLLSSGRSFMALSLTLALGYATASADSVVPLTYNGFIINNTVNGFGSFTYNGADDAQVSSLGPYAAFVYDSASASGGDTMNGSGSGWNVAVNSESPFDQLSGHMLDIDSSDYAVFDRAGFGINFDPNAYKLEVVYKPLPTNEAPVFNVQFDTHDGFIEETRDVPGVFVPGVGKRSGEQQQWGFGYGEEMNIQQLYDAGAKDADGFVTISTPLTDGMGGTGPDWTFTGPTFLFNSGDQNFQTLNTIQGEGDVDFGTFEDLTPNGVGQMHLQSAFIDDPEDPNLGRLHIEVKRISVVPINPDPSLVARLDARSGIGRRFGTPFATTTNPDGSGAIENPFLHEGNLVSVLETDQLQRFDQSGFTNLIIQTDDDDETGGFGIWQEPGYQTFDGTEATLEIRARLVPLNPNAQEANTRANGFSIVLNDIDGDDSEEGVGGEEYRFDIDTSTWNETDFVDLSIPLTDFDESITPTEFEFAGDGLLTDFNLYHLGIVTAQDGGLVGVEIEYIEIRVPGGLPGDFNGDGSVTLADYTAWRNQLGADESVLNGTGDGSGVVDQGDYQLWKDNFGSGAGAAALSSSGGVPEPGGLSILAIVIATLGGFRTWKYAFAYTNHS